MLNGEDVLKRAPTKRTKAATRSSRFQKLLHAHFDGWIEDGKPDLSYDRYEVLSSSMLLRSLNGEGEIQFFLDFSSPSGSDSPLSTKARAAKWFQLFQTIDGRKLLSKCSKCGRYFLRKRLRKRTLAQRYGEFCAEHKSQVRVRSTREGRERELGRKIEAAAALAAQWDPRRRNRMGDRWGWVVRNSNGQITRSWITRHLKEIECKLSGARG